MFVVGEHVDGVRYMLERRGTGQGSALVGRSVHNQRIERSWRDVFTMFLNFSIGSLCRWKTWEFLIPYLKLIYGVCMQFCFADLTG